MDCPQVSIHGRSNRKAASPVVLCGGDWRSHFGHGAIQARVLGVVLAAIACGSTSALADINEHAYALHLSGVGSSGAQVTVDEGSAFGVELLVSVETALADEDEADDELDALAAFVACDSGGRVLQVSGVTWLPGGSGGYGWADFNDDAAIGFDPPLSGYPQDLAPGSPLRLIGMEYPQTDAAGLSVDEVGTGLVLATIHLLAPAIDDPVEVFELSLISAGGQAPSASNNQGERQTARSTGAGLTVVVVKPDCNENGIPDIEEMADCPPGSLTCGDCNSNGLLDACDLTFSVSPDCNNNAVPDECDVPASPGFPGGLCEGYCYDDCDENGVPDLCQTFDDCNDNQTPDTCDVLAGTSQDCDSNGMPDECQIFDDCNNNGVADPCDIAGGSSNDCSNNGIPDECEPDCNDNDVADDCDISAGTSDDCTGNGIPDECEPDCNSNDVADSCDISSGTSEDCNRNGQPDECGDAAGFADCDTDGVDDPCEIHDDPALDCNGNWQLDSCDISSGPSLDCNTNTIPDECELDADDCDDDGVPDSCQISLDSGLDLNSNDLLDTCEDCNSNGIPDPCDVDCNVAGCAGVVGCGYKVDDNANGLPDDCERVAPDDLLAVGPLEHALYLTDLVTIEGGYLEAISGIAGTPSITGVAYDALGDTVYAAVNPGTPRSSLYAINPSSGQAQSITTLLYRVVRALAFDSSDGLDTLYLGATDYPGEDSLLLLVDPDTGDVRHQIEMDVTGQWPTGLAYDSRRDLLYAAFSKGALYSFQINEATGTASETLVGQLSLPLDNLAYDVFRDRLLAVADDVLYIVDPLTADVFCAGTGFVSPLEASGVAYRAAADPPVQLSPWDEWLLGSGRGTGMSESCSGASDPDVVVDPSTDRPIVVYEDSGTVRLLRFDPCDSLLVPWREMALSYVSGVGGQAASDPAVTMLNSSGTWYPVVAWSESFDNPPGWPDEIYIRRLNTAGDGWIELGSGSASGRGISDTVSTSSDPVVAVTSNGTPIVAWNEKNEVFGFEQIYVRKRSSATGHWVELGSGSASGAGVSGSAGVATDVDLAIDHTGGPVLAWADSSDDTGGDFDIYVVRWNGQYWDELGSGSASGDGITATSSYDDRQPALAVDDVGQLYVAWSSCLTGDCAEWRQVKVLRWDGGSWGPLGSSAGMMGISGTPGNSTHPAMLAATGQDVTVAWADDTAESSQVLVRKWNGAQWVEVGPGSAVGVGISGTVFAGAATAPVMTADADGNLIAAWTHTPAIEGQPAQAGQQVFVRAYGPTGETLIDANSNGMPDECEQPAKILTAQSCKDHNGTDYCLDLGDGDEGGTHGDNVEPRVGPEIELEFVLDSPVAAVEAQITCEPVGSVTADQVSVTTDPVQPDLLYVSCNLSGLEADECCCIVTLTGDVDDSHGVAVLVGDVNRGGIVNTLDSNPVELRFGETVDGTNFIYDVKHDGIINAEDYGAIKARYGNAVTTCP